MPPSNPSQPTSISFGPKRVEQRHEQTFIEKTAIVVLVLSIVGAGAAVGYRFYKQSQLTKIQSQIADAEDTYTNEAYENIRMFDRTVRAARFMLGNRMDHTRIFTALEETVSRSIFYQSFESIIDETGNVSLALSGVSPQFAQVVLQSSSLDTASLLSGVRLSRIELKKTDSGNEALFGVQASIARSELLRGTRQASGASTPTTNSGATPTSVEIAPVSPSPEDDAQ